MPCAVANAFASATSTPMRPNTPPATVPVAPSVPFSTLTVSVTDIGSVTGAAGRSQRRPTPPLKRARPEITPPTSAASGGGIGTRMPTFLSAALTTCRSWCSRPARGPRAGSSGSRRACAGAAARPAGAAAGAAGAAPPPAGGAPVGVSRATARRRAACGRSRRCPLAVRARAPWRVTRRSRRRRPCGRRRRCCACRPARRRGRGACAATAGVSTTGAACEPGRLRAPCPGDYTRAGARVNADRARVAAQAAGSRWASCPSGAPQSSIEAGIGMP